MHMSIIELQLRYKITKEKGIIMKFYIQDKNNQDKNEKITYWSNAIGELHHNGEYMLKDESELPKELQRAYKELWGEGTGSYEYLVEFKGKYYIAVENEYTEEDCEDRDKGFDILARNAIALKLTQEFKDTILILQKDHEFENEYRHNAIFLYPAYGSKEKLTKIENTLFNFIYKTDLLDISMELSIQDHDKKEYQLSVPGILKHEDIKNVFSFEHEMLTEYRVYDISCLPKEEVLIQKIRDKYKWKIGPIKCGISIEL